MAETEKIPVEQLPPEMRPKQKFPYPGEKMFPTFSSFTTTIQDFLSSFKAASPLFPKLFTGVITVSTDATLLEAFQVLIEFKIMAVPMLSFDGKVEGTFSMHDFLNILVTECEESEIASLKGDEFRSYLEKKQFVNKRLKEFPEIGQLEPTVTIRLDETLLRAAQLMIEHKSHRVLVIDEKGVLVNLITQSRLVALISTVLDTVPDAVKTIEELKLGFKDVLTVKDDTTAFKAFKTLRDHKVSACGVVDSQGKLKGNFSVQDLKTLGYKLEFFNLLAQPLFKYLMVVRGNADLIAPRPIDQPVLCAKPRDTLEYVMKTLYAYRVHRIYIVNDEFKPIGIIALYDVLKLLLTSVAKSSA